MVSLEGILGCGTYEVQILTRGGGSLVATFPWNSLSWSRVLDDTSSASAVANAVDSRCCDLLASLRPWRHELAIYRDGDQVWVGPVFDIGAPEDQYQVDGRDLTAWWDHRLIHQDHDYTITPTDLADIFQAYSDDAMAPDPSPGLSIATSLTGITGTPKVLGSQHQLAGQQLRDLSNVGIDWTAINRTILAGGLVVPTQSIGTFTDDHFAVAPVPHRPGAYRTNLWVVRGSGGGDAGDTIYGVSGDPTFEGLDGLLENVATIPTIVDNDSAQAAAASRVDLTRDVTLVDQGTLAPDAPFTIDQLVPGALCNLALERTCIPVSGEFRLQKVDVSAQPGGLTETVTLTFQPIGTLE